jgi:ABC-type proline/glycine betaine transport system permease subunit/ABC-type proline/glycine betaine transport system substrate-binding protein
MSLPRIPLDKWVDAFIQWLQVHFKPLFDVVNGAIEPTVDFFQHLLSVLPPIWMILLLTLLVWLVSNLRIAIFAFIGLLLIYDLQLWSDSVLTIALVLTATLISVVVGIPLGILAGRSDKTKGFLFPILDFMQTMPSFIYLIPAVFFFALGNVPAEIASIIFAMPPTIRMTSLGLRQVSKELKEAADAFGTTSWQKLIKVELPLARSTILAGINQTIMLSLSMVVVGSMIGADGLGKIVLQSISRLQVGKGFEAGLAIAIIAIILDRVTQNLGNAKSAAVNKKAPIFIFRKWLTVATIIALLGMTVYSYVGTGSGKKKIVLTYVAWDSEIASTNVVKKVLEKAGYDVEIQETEAAPMWEGVVSGAADAHVCAWFPAASKVFADKYKGQFDDLGPNLTGARIGLVVPQYVPIHSVAELNNYSDKFNGQIIGIDPGSGEMQLTEKLMKQYHLNHFQLVSGTDASMVASLDKAYKQKKWIVITGWEPHWKFLKYKLKFLDDPKGVYGGPQTIHTIARKGLKKDMPKAYAILDRFHWTKEDMEEVMLKVHNGMSPDQAAAEWVKSHPKQVNEWLGK